MKNSHLFILSVIILFIGSYLYTKYAEKSLVDYNLSYIKSVKDRCNNAKSVQETIDILNEELVYAARPPQNEKIKQVSIDFINMRLEAARKKKRDLDAWEEAIKVNTIESYSTYLTKYPNGNFRRDAIEKRKQKEREEFEEEKRLLEQEKAKLAEERERAKSVAYNSSPNGQGSDRFVIANRLKLKKLICHTHQESWNSLIPTKDRVTVKVNGKVVVSEYHMEQGDVYEFSFLPAYELNSNSNIIITVLEIDDAKKQTLLEKTFTGNKFKKLGTYNYRDSFQLGDYTLVYELR